MSDFRVFISYAKVDTRELAIALDDAIGSVEGLSSWVDRELRRGTSWAREIELQIDACDLFVVLLSPDVNRKSTEEIDESFVITEIHRARYISKPRKPILPVMAQLTPPPIEIGTTQYLDVTQMSLGEALTAIVEDVCEFAGIESPRQKWEREEAERVERERLARLEAQRKAQQEEQNRRAKEQSERERLAKQEAQRKAQQEEQYRPVSEQAERERLEEEKEQLAQEESEHINYREDARLQSSQIEFPTAKQTPRLPYIVGAVAVLLVIAGISAMLLLNGDNYLELARAGVSSNDQWEPYIQQFGGTEMVLVPAGCFMMGSEDRPDNESPMHEQCFNKPFWIDRYEVTNAEFGSTGCETYSSEPEQPRNCVTWFEARDYCAGRDARLPTEHEWEYAARGPDSLVYPWGNTYDAALVISEDDPTYGDTETAPVGSRPDGASWVGAMDMSGNVWERVSTIYGVDDGDYNFSGDGEFVYEYPYDAGDGRERDSDERTNVRVLRGGSSFTRASVLRAAYRAWVNPGDGHDGDYGFRCARSS
jgi:formylglycine-generating enzyme required for sulfatase activity